MKLQVMSDLHLEHHRDGGATLLAELAAAQPTDIDILVLAGDIVNLRRQKNLDPLRWFCDHYPRICYLPGNHEYYGTNPKGADDRLRHFIRTHPAIYSLKPGVAYLGPDISHKSRTGYHHLSIFGATMWFSRAQGNERYYDRINDFALIGGSFPEYAYRHNEQFHQFLTDVLLPGDTVITHHLPSYKSVHPRYEGDPLNRFFVSDMEDIIEERKPALWIHGHTHESCDYTIGITRVVCNPYGYPHERNPNFDPALVIEI